MATGARVVAAARLEAVHAAGVRSPDVYGLLIANRKEDLTRQPSQRRSDLLPLGFDGGLQNRRSRRLPLPPAASVTSRDVP